MVHTDTTPAKDRVLTMTLYLNSAKTEYDPLVSLREDLSKLLEILVLGSIFVLCHNVDINDDIEIHTLWPAQWYKCICGILCSASWYNYCVSRLWGVRYGTVRFDRWMVVSYAYTHWLLSVNPPSSTSIPCLAGQFYSPATTCLIVCFLPWVNVGIVFPFSSLVSLFFL